MLTKQEVFDKVVTHLRKQNAKSMSSAGGCFYRFGEKKCAVGCLIPDELYSPRLEGLGVASMVLEDVLLKAGIPESCFSLLTCLQTTHDDCNVGQWEIHFQELAEAEGLEFKPC